MDILKNIRDAFLGTPGRVQFTALLLLILYNYLNPGVLAEMLRSFLGQFLGAVLPFQEAIFVLLVMLFGCNWIYKSVFGGGGKGKK